MFLRAAHLTSCWWRERGLAPQGEWRHMPAHCSLHITPAWEALEKRESFARILEVASSPLIATSLTRGFLRARAPLLAGFLSVGGDLSGGSGSTGQNQNLQDGVGGPLAPLHICLFLQGA